MKRLSSPESLDGTRPESAPHPSFGEAFLFWLKLGFISFGGPTGQIAVMHTELVEKKKWISEARFLHALNYYMLLPGPEAQQLATYVGWLLHKTWGGVVAGAFFVIPSIFILWGLSYIYVTLGNLPWIAAIFYGLKPAVLAIVAAAVIPHREPSFEKRSDVDVGRRGIYSDLFLPRPISINHHQCRADRILRRQVEAG
jgi:chromate transporter